MRVRLSFDQDPDGRFVLLVEERDASSFLRQGPVTVTSFEHEDLFLKRLVEADLGFTAVAAIAGTVLKMVSGSSCPARSVDLEVTRDQFAMLGLAQH